jgi:hypothetical protein
MSFHPAFSRDGFEPDSSAKSAMDGEQSHFATIRLSRLNNLRTSLCAERLDDLGRGEGTGLLLRR